MLFQVRLFDLTAPDLEPEVGQRVDVVGFPDPLAAHFGVGPAEVVSALVGPTARLVAGLLGARRGDGPADVVRVRIARTAVVARVSMVLHSDLPELVLAPSESLRSHERKLE